MLGACLRNRTAVARWLHARLTHDTALTVAAATAFRAAAPTLAEALQECASGRELAERGYGEDVAVAAEPDVADVVPLLDGERFVAARW